MRFKYVDVNVEYRSNDHEVFQGNRSLEIQCEVGYKTISFLHEEIHDIKCHLAYSIVDVTMALWNQHQMIMYNWYY